MTIICLLFFVSLPIDIFRARVVLFNATFNSISVISWRLVLFDEETGIPGQNHRPPVCHWQTLSHCCIEHSSSWAGFELTTLVGIGIHPNTIRSRRPLRHLQAVLSCLKHIYKMKRLCPLYITYIIINLFLCTRP